MARNSRREATLSRTTLRSARGSRPAPPRPTPGGPRARGRRAAARGRRARAPSAGSPDRRSRPRQRTRAASACFAVPGRPADGTVLALAGDLGRAGVGRRGGGNGRRLGAAAGRRVGVVGARGERARGQRGRQPHRSPRIRLTPASLGRASSASELLLEQPRVDVVHEPADEDRLRDQRVGTHPLHVLLERGQLVRDHAEDLPGGIQARRGRRPGRAAPARCWPSSRTGCAGSTRIRSR